MSLPPHHHITGGHLRQEPLEWPQNQNATGNGQAPTGTSHNFPHPSGHQHATAAHYQYNSTIGTNIHPSPVVPQRFTTYNYNSSCLPPPPPTAHAHPFYPRTHPAPPHSHQNNNNMANAAVAQQIPRISIAPTPTTHPPPPHQRYANHTNNVQHRHKNNNNAPTATPNNNYAAKPTPTPNFKHRSLLKFEPSEGNEIDKFTLPETSKHALVSSEVWEKHRGTVKRKPLSMRMN